MKKEPFPTISNDQLAAEVPCESIYVARLDRVCGGVVAAMKPNPPPAAMKPKPPPTSNAGNLTLPLRPQVDVRNGPQGVIFNFSM